MSVTSACATANLNPLDSNDLISVLTTSSGLRLESPAPALSIALPYDSIVSPLSGLPPTNAQRAKRSAASLSRGVVVGDVRISGSAKSPARSAPAKLGGIESPTSAVCSETSVEVDPTTSTVKRIG